jgi:hypothetical protein
MGKGTRGLRLLGKGRFGGRRFCLLSRAQCRRPLLPGATAPPSASAPAPPPIRRELGSTPGHPTWDLPLGTDGARISFDRREFKVVAPSASLQKKILGDAALDALTDADPGKLDLTAAAVVGRP